MDNNIYFHCPDWFRGKNFYEELIKLSEEHPEYFYENSKISHIFGSVPSMIWNGGGFISGEIANLEYIYELATFYNDLHIPISLTLTNPLIIEKDCYDRYCNKVVEIFENGHNNILVSSPILEEYLRKNFCGYTYTKSIITTEKDRNFEDDLNTYDMVVLPRRKVKDFDYLNSIKQENRSKFELLCNDPCPITCPRLYSHYKEFAKVSLYEQTASACASCSAFEEKDLPIRELKYIENQITLSEIQNKYLNLGFNNFKIAGRGSALSVCKNVLPFFIKSEYLYEIIFYLLYSI